MRGTSVSWDRFLDNLRGADFASPVVHEVEEIKREHVVQGYYHLQGEGRRPEQLDALIGDGAAERIYSEGAVLDSAEWQGEPVNAPYPEYLTVLDDFPDDMALVADLGAITFSGRPIEARSAYLVVEEDTDE